ncbi:hypothetical protein Tco_0800562 [Tanacetum coccineum]|uniref:Reverse transcriptase domain-containing protein n=1 Tax=Tanacetum coccineum TaxID=301880 RepID=A0ABQ4ZTJ3_9ASTR
MQNQNSSGSGSLPSNTVANPRGDVKAITTQSGVALCGPTFPHTPSPLPKEVKRENRVRDKDRTARALIDVYGEELALRVDDEAITFKVGQTSRYSRSYEMVNQVNVIDIACEEYAQEVLGFSDRLQVANPSRSSHRFFSPSFTLLDEGDSFWRA